MEGKTSDTTQINGGNACEPAAAAPQSVTLPSAADLLKAKIHLVITALFKGYLCRMEEWTEDHDAAMAKLKAALPDDIKHYVELADYLPDTKLEHHRTAVLRAGNNAIRELQEVVDSLRLK